jgi:hypothetical protein
MLASGLLIGFAAGLFSGGRPERLAAIRIRWWPVLAVGMGIRIVASLIGEVPLPVYLAAFASIASVAVVDRSLPGMRWMVAGAVSNLLVVTVNLGMPVDATAVQIAGTSIPSDGLHRELVSGDRFAFLADVIPFPVIARVYSVGDLALAWGALWLVFTGMRKA